MGVDARRAVTLEVDHVAVEPAFPPAAEEVVEADLVEGGRRGEGRDVAAEAGVLLVGPHHHRHGVPADDALDAALDGAVAAVGGLLALRDGVDVGGVAGEGEDDVLLVPLLEQLLEQETRPVPPLDLDQLLERGQPLLGLVDVAIRLSTRVPVEWSLIRLAHSQCLLRSMRDHPRAPSPEGDTSTQGEATRKHMTTQEVAGRLRPPGPRQPATKRQAAPAGRYGRGWSSPRGRRPAPGCANPSWYTRRHRTW